jgi:hypothetical protein
MQKFARHLAFVAAVSVVASACQPKEDPQVTQLKKDLDAAKTELADKQAQAQAQTGAAVDAVKSAQDTAATATTKALADQDAAISRQKADAAKQADENARLAREVEAMKPREFTLPPGTIIPARTTSENNTIKYKNGSVFDAVLEHDLVAEGTIIAKAGALVHCVVVEADPGGRVKGKASLSVAARTIAGVDGNTLAVKTESYGVGAASTKKKDTARGAVATGAGAIIGGIAGGGKGAAIGAGVGAAAGVGTAMATRGDAAVIPTETLIAFTLSAPAAIVLRK